jgi:hypothetical protein
VFIPQYTALIFISDFFFVERLTLDRLCCIGAQNLSCVSAYSVLEIVTYPYVLTLTYVFTLCEL